jgi:phage-related protein (TIGR01555 family)
MDNAITRLFRPQKKQVTDSAVVSSSGAGGSGDRTQNQLPGVIPAYKYFPGGMNPYGLLYTLWESFWEARKIVDIPPGDMVREGWKWEHPDIDPDYLQAISDTEDTLDVTGAVFRALQYERLYGAGAILLGTAEVQGDAEKPLDINSIGRGDLKFIRPLPRHILTPSEYNTDPLSAAFQNPSHYTINGSQVHASRLIIFDGGGDVDPFGYAIRLGCMGYRSKDGFGTSVLLPLWDDIIRSAGSRQAGQQLIEIASILILQQHDKTGSLAYSKSGEAKNEALRTLLDQVSIYRGAFIDGYDLQTVTASFGSIPELLIQYLQVLSAASDIPAPRFLGQAPGGLNASGKGDLVNYYDSIGSKQKIKLRPALLQLGQVLVRSALGLYPKGLQLEFEPLMQLTEDMKADQRTKDANNIYMAIDRGLGDDEWAAKELMERDIFLNDPLKVDDEEIDADINTAGSREVIPEVQNQSPTDTASESS